MSLLAPLCFSASLDVCVCVCVCASVLSLPPLLLFLSCPSLHRGRIAAPPALLQIVICLCVAAFIYCHLFDCDGPSLNFVSLGGLLL